ncbi:E3 ubiquitin-protein ligase trim56 [Plakobranchus ocellatus]|uniref:E3 ubiquitin-protein ligase trim56 n=1 Tax=Plakobranchus ocellatus TaxID=259542 RepID=A0AAV3Z476_9GAST|nr:E3 ubiquitin-protein ligase trim56 [Plakobranchus ocellatus]
MATGTRLMQEISDQFLNCKICFESFREPKTLTCLHTFCLDCLQQQYEQEVTSRSSRFTLYTTRTITCPLCRKKTELPAGGVRRLPDNFLVCNLNQVLAKRTVSRVPPCDICASVRGKSVDACSKCLDCTKLLCKACVDLHLGTKVTQHHSLIDLEGEKDIVCKVHTEEIVKFYCEPCGACICVSVNITNITVSRVPPCDICASVRGKSVDACSKCLDCTKLLCKACIDLHLGTKVTQHHSLIDLEGEKDIVCKVHTEEIVKFYCEPCGACICVVCAFQEHRDHDVLSFSDGYAKYRGDLESLLDKCKTRAQEVSSRLNTIDKYETVVKDVRERIRDLAISSIAKVRAKERELMKRIDDVYGGEVQAFVDSRPVLQDNLDELQSTVQLTDIMLRDKGVEVLLIKRDIEVKMEQLLEPRLETIPSDPTLYDIRFVPGDVVLGKLSFGEEPGNEEEEDEISKLKKKEQTQVKKNVEVLDNGTAVSVHTSSTKATSPQNDPDVITNCTQTEKCRTTESSTSMQGSKQSIVVHTNIQSKENIKNTVKNGACTHDYSSKAAGVGSEIITDESGVTNGRRSNLEGRKLWSLNTIGNGHSEQSSTSDLFSQTDSSSLESAAIMRARRRAEREARKEAASGIRSDRAPAPDLVPIGSTSRSANTSTTATSSGAYSYTPGRMIRSRKIQTEISALDVEAGVSNSDREFVQTILQAELAAERLRQEKELASLSPRLRDRPRRVRTAEMGVMTMHKVRIVPEMLDKETASECVQHRDVALQALSESSTNYTQTPVVRLENSGMCTDREGQAEKGTATVSIDLEDKETCTAVIMSETKGTWTDAVATSDRATATMAIKLQHRAIGTVPTSTGTRGCQINPQVNAVFTNTPVITTADLEVQATPNVCHTATMPDPDKRANNTIEVNQPASLNVSESAADFLTPPQSPSRFSPTVTCDRASDAYHTPSHNKSTETVQVQTISSSTETPTVKVVDRDMATEETKTLNQWTETYTPTLINTGVTPPRPDTLEVGVATDVVLTDEQATCTDIVSFRDTHTETALVVCDGETLTDPVGHSDAQTSVEIYTESRQCETDAVEISDETCMTEHYNPWEYVDTNTQASQCDTAILKTKETNTAQVKRKAKEAQTAPDPDVCPECGNVEKKDEATQDLGVAGTNIDPILSKAFRDSSTMPQLQVTQDVGTMAISCNVCNHQYQETAIQTFQPKLYDKSSATSFDLHENFLACALSREYHDVATSTDSLPIIGLLSEIDVDELIVVPDSAPELVSTSGDSAHTGDRVIMVDDETSTDLLQSVETGTQTFVTPSPTNESFAEGDTNLEGVLTSSFGRPFKAEDEAGMPENSVASRSVGKVIQSLVKSEQDKTRLSIDTSSVGGDETVSTKAVCTNLSCPSRQDKHLISIGVNTEPKQTFEKETSTPEENRLPGNQMTIYVTKMDKGTSTLNRVRIVQGRASGVAKQTKSVDKITMTSQVEHREVGVETEPQQIDGKLTECISKLRSVSERLNSPAVTPPAAKEAPSHISAGNAFFGKVFSAEKSGEDGMGEQSSATVSPASRGSDLERQNHVKHLLDQTNAILKRKDFSPARKPQPITTLKGRKPGNVPISSPDPLKASAAPSESTKLVPTIAADEQSGIKPEPEAGAGYASKSLPRGFTSERRSNTVKMGSQPLSPTRLPLHRYNSAPGRIATVPAQTLLIKSGGATGKLGHPLSPRLSPNETSFLKSENSQENTGNINEPAAWSKAIENKPFLPTPSAGEAVLPKPLKRQPLPSITETRTPSSCSDNSTTSQNSSGSNASKRQTADSTVGTKILSPTPQKKLTTVQQSAPKNISSTKPKSPLVSPKRVANISLGAPTQPDPTRKSVRDAPKSPSARRKGPTAEPGTPATVKSSSPAPKRVGAKDSSSTSTTPRSSCHSNQQLTLDPNRLSVQSACAAGHSRSPSNTSLSASMSDSASDSGVSSSKKGSKARLKSSPSPSKEKIKSSASTETIQSNTSTENVDGTKPKKSGGIGFMQRFLSKKKKSSDTKKDALPVNTKLCPPTADTVAALSTLPGPVPAGPKESYAHVPIQHPPHHYIPQPEVKPQTPVHKPSSFVYVNQRLICIQQDNVEEKKANRESKKKSDSILVAHKQAMFAEKAAAKTSELPRDTKTDEKKKIEKSSGKDSAELDKGRATEGQACADLAMRDIKKNDGGKSSPEENKAQPEASKEKEKLSTDIEIKQASKGKDAKTKSKKSEVKSASSWIRGRGDKSSKK